VKRDPQVNARQLYQIASAQGGYFTATQARQVGYAYSQQHFHVQRGNWLRIDHGIFRLHDYPPGEREDLIRWSLWSRNQKGIPQAVVSHVPPGCVLHKSRLAPGDVEARPGYRVTTPLRTLLDVAGSPLSQEHLNAAVRDALQRGLVRRRQLENASASPQARHRLDRALSAVPMEGSPQ
jgi:hypothetical protein